MLLGVHTDKGAVVPKEVISFTIVAGSPARPMGVRTKALAYRLAHTPLLAWNRQVMHTILRRFAVRGRDFLLDPVLRSLRRAALYQERTSQMLLTLEYQRLKREGQPLPALSEVGFRAYSQTDEDGILHFLFSILGVKYRTCVEICAGTGEECNTANLIIHHGWRSLLIDGDEDNVRRGQHFFRSFGEINVLPPRYIRAWVTRDNVDALLTEHGFTGAVDLLSLDLDGVDYWIWEAMTAINPRVVVLEFQNILGPERSWTVPYTEDFSARGYPMSGDMPNFAGASLLAFTRLARRRGYRLVGTNRSCYNAFYVRDDVAGSHLPAVETAACFDNPWTQAGMRERFPLVKNLPWQEV